MEGTTSMEGSTWDLFIDSEDSLKDTIQRIQLGDDPDTSREIKLCDLRLAVKNMKQFEKIYLC